MPGDQALASNDSDKDGLNDALEVSIATDPCAADTDKDGVPDGLSDQDHDGLTTSSRSPALGTGT